MERVELSTENIIDENVEKLAELFPEVVTEVREPDGTLRHAIDVEALKARVGDVAEGQRERYQFTWPGKREAKQEAYRQIDKCLRPCPEESVDWDTTQNLYIEGDNLDALKLLRNTYAGKIKMIYIDPPYNTGHDFIYDDDFSKTKADYDEESGDYNEEGGRLVANPESNGRFHSDWCSMMYPRLLLARDLLTEDGVIFISIDDYEQDNLRKLSDEVFGEKNFVAILTRKALHTVRNSSKDFNKNADYVLVYIRDRSVYDLNPSDWFRQKGDKSASYPYDDRDGKGPYKLDPLYARNYAKPYTYTFLNGLQWSAPEGSFPRYSIETLRRMEKEGEVVISASGNPSAKRYLARVQVGQPPDAVLRTEHVKFNSDGTRLLADTLGIDKAFSQPKPIELVKYLASLRETTNSYILDFFSGSATTAHAVMKLNAEDGGNRKFIMVQLPEACDEKSEAAKAGYKNICEIGKERIRRAGKKIAEEIAEENRQPKLGEEPKKVPDIGFRVLKIDSSNFVDVSAEPAEYTQQTLAGLADNLKPGRTAEDLLFQVMPQFQIPLSAKIEKRDINGSSVFSVDDGRLVACFDRNVATETIVAMAKLQPDYAVMRDASFTGDDAVSNFGELFKTYSPATITRVV